MPRQHSQVYLDRVAAGIFNKRYVDYLMSEGYTDRQARRSLVETKQKMKNGYTVRPLIIK